MTTRRALIGTLIAFVAAPAIVRATSLMPVKVVEDFEFSGFSIFPMSEMSPEMMALFKRRIDDAYRITAENIKHNLYGP